jgi:hypothetical protein
VRIGNGSVTVGKKAEGAYRTGILDSATEEDSVARPCEEKSMLLIGVS